VLQFHNEETHNHELTQAGLPESTRVGVDQLFVTGTDNPNYILKALREKGICEPKKNPLNNYFTSFQANRGMHNFQIGLEFEEKVTNVRKEAKNIPLGEKRKNCSKALLQDTFNIILIFNYCNLNPSVLIFEKKNYFG
jgi:hypothetical protein